MDSDQWFVVGKVLRPWGNRGGVAVENRSAHLERFRKLSTIRARLPGKQETQTLCVAEVRFLKQRPILFFEGFTSINDAETLRNTLLEVPPEEAITLEEDEFFFHDLVGCKVLLEDGSPLGEVADIMETSANEILIVRHGKQEWLIPFIEVIIRKVDLPSGTITIFPMPGLLGDED